ncbi:hypothetical protein VTO42DRAFT_4076 [Malbranchea cinnamomea]
MGRLLARIENGAAEFFFFFPAWQNLPCKTRSTKGLLLAFCCAHHHPPRGIRVRDINKHCNLATRLARAYLRIQRSRSAPCRALTRPAAAFPRSMGKRKRVSVTLPDPWPRLQRTVTIRADGEYLHNGMSYRLCPRLLPGADGSHSSKHRIWYHQPTALASATRPTRTALLLMHAWIRSWHGSSPNIEFRAGRTYMDLCCALYFDPAACTLMDSV